MSARTRAMDTLVTMASTMGGDVVEDARFEVSQLSGQGKSMLLVLGYGTAVRLGPPV